MFYEQIKCIYGNIEKVLAPREIEILKYRYGLLVQKNAHRMNLLTGLELAEAM